MANSPKARKLIGCRSPDLFQTLFVQWHDCPSAGKRYWWNQMVANHKKQDTVWNLYKYWGVLYRWLSFPTQIAKFMGPWWGPPGSCRPQMGPILAPWTLLSGYYHRCGIVLQRLQHLFIDGAMDLSYHGYHHWERYGKSWQNSVTTIYHQ